MPNANEEGLAAPLEDPQEPPRERLDLAWSSSPLVIVPRQDLRSVAAKFVHELPRGVRLLLRGLGAGSNSGLQLVSYLLFESGFTRALIDMGYRDAMEMEDELRAFIFDQPMATLYAPAHLKLALDG